MDQFHNAFLSNFCLTKLEIFDDGIKVKRVDRYANPHSLEEAAVKAGWNKRGKMNGRANIAAISAVCEWEERARRKKGREAKVVIAECRRVWRSERNERGGRTVRWLMADFASLYRGCPFVPAFRETAARRARGSDQRSHGINLLFSCPTILPFSSPVPPRSPLGDNWPAYKNIPPKSRWHTISDVSWSYRIFFYYAEYCKISSISSSSLPSFHRRNRWLVNTRITKVKADNIQWEVIEIIRWKEISRCLGAATPVCILGSWSNQANRSH